MVDLTQLDKFFVDDFVKDIFIGTLQELFYRNKGEFHYDPDDAVSKLNITDQFSTDNLTPEFKPTIYIRRRPLGFMNTSIDQYASGNLMTGVERHTDLISGTVDLVSVSRVGLEACRLGSIVFVLMQEFRSQIRSLGMFDVTVKSLGEEEPKDIRATMRIVEVPVTLQFMFQYSWMLQRMDLKPLAGIEVGRSTDVTTGEPLIGLAGNSCEESEGLGTDGDGQNKKICIPMSSTSPKRSQQES